MLKILNEYNITKYCNNESVYTFGNLNTECKLTIINLMKYCVNISLKKWKPVKRTYFHDTKYNMFGYITYHSDKIVDHHTVYTLQKNITLEIDIIKSQYTFMRYYELLSQLENKKTILIANNFSKSSTVYLNIFENKNITHIDRKLLNNYFPGIIYAVTYDYERVFNLATSFNKYILVINNPNDILEYRHNILSNNIIIINCTNKLLVDNNFNIILDIARHTNESIIILRIKNYNQIIGTKLQNYITWRDH